uniref:Uncharacterized protein n=1 Tax=Arundo donax TaxID=35708 RepID=A0A0A8ZVS1_ARUDO
MWVSVLAAERWLEAAAMGTLAFYLRAYVLPDACLCGILLLQRQGSEFSVGQQQNMQRCLRRVSVSFSPLSQSVSFEEDAVAAAVNGFIMATPHHWGPSQCLHVIMASSQSACVRVPLLAFESDLQ